MAVDVKTLRIGSHVEYEGKRMVVASVSGKIMNAENLTLIDESTLTLYDKVNGYDVEPISITPELLAELGFQYRDNTYWERWFLGSFDIERKEGSSYFDYNSEIRLEFLHELEDLYYLIYGVELIREGE